MVGPDTHTHTHTGWLSDSACNVSVSPQTTGLHTPPRPSNACWTRGVSWWESRTWMSLQWGEDCVCGCWGGGGGGGGGWGWGGGGGGGGDMGEHKQVLSTATSCIFLSCLHYSRPL